MTTTPVVRWPFGAAGSSAIRLHRTFDDLGPDNLYLDPKHFSLDSDRISLRWAIREFLAIVMAMSISENIPLAEVKNRLSEVVERLEREHGRVVITKHGRPAAVVLSIEDLESLEETLDIVGDTALLTDIEASLRDLAEGRVQTLTKEEALEGLTGR